MRAVLITLGLPLLVLGLSVLLSLRVAARQAGAVFLPLTTLLIALYALTGVVGLMDKRGLLIVTGLAVAGLAMAARSRSSVVLPLGLAGMGVCLNAAVLSGVTRAGVLWFLLPALVLMVGLMAFLWQRLEARVWPLLLGTVLVSLIGLTGQRWLEFGTLGAALALAGAGFFAVAGVLFIVNPRQRVSASVLLFYYSAQWLWALSVLLRYAELGWFI